MAENEQLRAKIGTLRQANLALQGQVERLEGGLQTALERIAELEQGQLEPPPFIRPNRRGDTRPRLPCASPAAPS